MRPRLLRHLVSRGLIESDGFLHNDHHAIEAVHADGIRVTTGLGRSRELRLRISPQCISSAICGLAPKCPTSIAVLAVCGFQSWRGIHEACAGFRDEGKDVRVGGVDDCELHVDRENHEECDAVEGEVGLEEVCRSDDQSANDQWYKQSGNTLLAGTAYSSEGLNVYVHGSRTEPESSSHFTPYGHVL